MMTIYFKKTLLLCSLLCAAMFISCSDDKDGVTPLPDGQGEVMFKFVRNHVYTVSSLEEMARLKVTLEKEGKQIVLPTIDLTGDKDSLSTTAIRLENGTYQVKKYVAFNSKGTQVQEAYLDEENTLTVENGKMSDFYFPISIRFVYINNQVRNQLFGICQEVFGSDSTAWPKTWRVENEDLRTWENLEFELDDYGEIIYLSNIIFDKKFAGMKKLPNVVCEMSTLEGFQVRDLPEFEELPENFSKSSFYDISIVNTGLKSFPKDFEKARNLVSFTIINSKLTEIPARLSEMSQLTYVELRGNEISEFPAVLAEKWQSLTSLQLANTKISTLPDNFFEMKKVTTFDLSDNPSLSSLPNKRGDKTFMGNLFLDRCGFTAIPEIASTRMRALSMTNNKITSVSKEALDKLSDQLDWLNLDGNKLSSFPQMNSASLIGLSLNDCGLTAVPDLSALPNLRSIRMAKNQISTLSEGTFTNNPLISILDLSGNPKLTSISDKAGFHLFPQEEIQNGASVTVNKPYYLHLVNVDDCPNLIWTVPANWCCVKNIPVGNKDDEALPVRNVVVYHLNSPKVSREKCPVCNRSDYERKKSIDDFLADLKNKVTN